MLSRWPSDGFTMEKQDIKVITSPSLSLFSFALGVFTIMAGNNEG
jgi:hypothetical protein